MREMTNGEYRTALSILSDPGATERQRIRLSGLPSSTYNVARRRIFSEGWLTETLVPNPGPCGFGAVECLLARPSVSQRPALVDQWTRDRECVLLWSGVHALLGVFFRRAPLRTDPARHARPEEATPFRVTVLPDLGTVPAYFDYSGLWARFGGATPPTGYPAGLDVESKPSDRRTLLAAERLVHADASSTDPSARWPPFLGRGRVDRHSVDPKVIQTRALLTLARIPPLEGRRIGEAIFIQGLLREGVTAARLLNRLTAESRVYPFLFAEAGGAVILAGLGQTDSRQPGRVLVRSAVRSVMAIVTEHLDPADLLIEPVEALQELVGHRYPDRFPGLDRKEPIDVIP
jgi:hypothetical protein